jgi:hypothetical protein
MSKPDPVPLVGATPARRGRPPKIRALAVGGDTRESILDAAEDLCFIRRSGAPRPGHERMNQLMETWS